VTATFYLAGAGDQPVNLTHTAGMTYSRFYRRITAGLLLVPVEAAIWIFMYWRPMGTT